MSGNPFASQNFKKCTHIEDISSEDNPFVVDDDINMEDNENSYISNPDENKTFQPMTSLVKSKRPAGTFSDVMLTLPIADKLNSTVAHKLVSRYRNSLKNMN